MSEETEQLDLGIDLYDLLQVSPRAHPEVVHAAYRVLARRYHPDVSENPHAARMMRHVNAAYAVLRDDEKRARYDAYRMRSLHHTDRVAPRPYRAAPALERDETVPEPPQPSKRAAAILMAVLLGLLGIAMFTVDVFEDPHAAAAAGTSTGATAQNGGNKRSLGGLIIDATRLTPGPCGPQFPGPMNPC